MPAKKKLAKLKAKARSAKATVSKARAKVKSNVKSKVQARAKSARAAASKARAKPAKVTPVPKDFHTITTALTVNNCAEAIEFYERALGAKEISRMGMPGSNLVWHCHMKLGDSNLFLADPMPGAGPASSAENPSPVSMFLYVEDCDAAMQRAVDAGMTVTMPMMDAFWGDRMGNVIDKYGNSWAFASRKKLMTDEEMMKAGQAFAAEQAAQAQQPSPPPSGATALQTTPALA